MGLVLLVATQSLNRAVTYFSLHRRCGKGSTESGIRRVQLVLIRLRPRPLAARPCIRHLPTCLLNPLGFGQDDRDNTVDVTVNFAVGYMRDSTIPQV